MLTRSIFFNNYNMHLLWLTVDCTVNGKQKLSRLLRSNKDSSMTSHNNPSILHGHMNFYEIEDVDKPCSCTEGLTLYYTILTFNDPGREAI